MVTSDKKKLKLRACIVNGVLELASGGPIPIAEKTSFEITVEARNITDPRFRDIALEKRRVQILSEGTRLVVLFSSDQVVTGPVRFFDGFTPYEKIASRLQQHLSRGWEIQTPLIVGLTIGPFPPPRGQQHAVEMGGLWLKIEAGRPVGLEVSSVLLPDGYEFDEARSLNHAMTLISEQLEPWRISHTGNVYQRVYYEETNGWWYPLDWLRDSELHNAEHQIAAELWREFQADFKK